MPGKAPAQEAPLGSHHLGSLQGGAAPNVSSTGAYQASLPLGLPPARDGTPVPVSVVYGGGGSVGAAGLGWAVPLAYVVREDASTRSRRRPLYVDEEAAVDPSLVDETGAPFVDWTGPVVEPRVELVLFGDRFHMIGAGAETYHPLTGPATWSLHRDGDAWTLDDGTGRRYRFERLDGVSDAFWFLTGITSAAGPANRMELEYRVEAVAPAGAGDEADTVPEVLLRRVAYDRHPEAGCMKHGVRLVYERDPRWPGALGFRVESGAVRARSRLLSAVELWAREECEIEAHRVERTELHYERDFDTRLPRLHEAVRFGRQGTEAARDPLPVARYRYGRALSHDPDGEGRVLRYTATPPARGPERRNVMGLLREAAPSGGSFAYRTLASLRDHTGDGVADQVTISDDGELVIARGDVTLHRLFRREETELGPLVPLFDRDDAPDALSERTTSSRRYEYAPARLETEDTRIEQLDFNGDGRLDLLRAGPGRDTWTLYLNVPPEELGRPGPETGAAAARGIEWEVRELDVSPLREVLELMGHDDLPDDVLPLARTTTGQEGSLPACWDVSGSGEPVRVPLAECPEPSSLEIDVERSSSFTEWMLEDVNGDRYPDLVASHGIVTTSAVPEPACIVDVDGDDEEPRKLCPLVFSVGLRSGPLSDLARGAKVFFNRAGVRAGAPPVPFSSPRSVLRGAGERGCTVETWSAVHRDDGARVAQELDCGFVDVNGDGIADRVRGDAVRLGTGDGRFPVELRLPGPAVRIENPQEPVCTGATEPRGYDVRQVAGLLDLTGDGMAEYVDGSRVYMGTGLGWGADARPVPVAALADFTLSTARESCSGSVSNTVRGLVDVNGDGRPELVDARSGGGELALHQLGGGGWPPGAPEAGRLVRVENFHGARTRVRYGSVKGSPLAHRVPFPEIAVTAIETVATAGRSPGLAPVRYAYGGARLVYDGARDRFVFPGYERTVAVSGLGFDDDFLPSRGPPGHAELALVHGAVTIRDAVDVDRLEDGFARHALRGRTRRIDVRRGWQPEDPEERLDHGPRRRSGPGGGVELEHAAESSSSGMPAPAPLGDCTGQRAYDLGPIWLAQDGLFEARCRTHGFGYVAAATSWEGDEPPSDGDGQVERATRWLDVDSLGRPHFILHAGDTAREDDDLCEERTYAEPVSGGGPRVLDAVHTRRRVACRPPQVPFAGVRHRYDGLDGGSVSRGLLTSTVVERYRTSGPAKIDEYVSHRVERDSETGRVEAVETRRTGDAPPAILRVAYDPFVLAPREVRLSHADLPADVVTRVERDPVTLQPTAVREADGATWRAAYDGHRRLSRRSVLPAGSEEPLALLDVEHRGDDLDATTPRRLRVRRFLSGVPLAELAERPELAAEHAVTATAFFDELGRVRRREIELGPDYGGRTLVLGDTRFDRLGRAVFVAAPHVRGEAPSPPFGTTMLRRGDGAVRCAAQGPGPQPVDVFPPPPGRGLDVPAPEPPAGVFLACAAHRYRDGLQVVRTRGPDSYRPDTPQEEVFREVVRTGAGRVLAVSTRREDEVLERLGLRYDALGRIAAVLRFAAPESDDRAVAWEMERDSLGRVLVLREPGVAERSFRYDRWGNALETEWPRRTLTREYDGLGRLLRLESSIPGIAGPIEATLAEYAYDAPTDDPAHEGAEVPPGSLARAGTPAQDVFLGYDALGRLSRVTRRSDDGTVVTERLDLRLDGQPRSLRWTLPGGLGEEVARYAYDSAGRLRTVSSEAGGETERVFEAPAIDPFGRYRRVVYGNGVEERFDYAPGGRRELRSWTVRTPEGESRTSFAYDPALRVVSREVAPGPAAGLPRREEYRYDPIGRLMRARVGRSFGADDDLRFGYDPLGNLVSRFDERRARLRVAERDDDDPDRLCSISGFDWDGTGKPPAGGAAAAREDPDPPPQRCSIRYDPRGNVTRFEGPGRTEPFTARYDGLSRVLALDAGRRQARFAYDPAGRLARYADERFPPADPLGGGDSDAGSADDGFERVTRRFGPRVDVVDVTAAEEPARRTVERRIPGPLGVVLSRHGDAGSTAQRYWHGGAAANRIFTGDGGAVVQAMRYGPYGEVLEDTGEPGEPGHVDQLWNRGERIHGFGLTLLGPRLYDPATGRFLQRDPVLPAGRGASRLQPYAFAWNDPVNRADPSGLDPQVDCSGGACGDDSVSDGTVASLVALGASALSYGLELLSANGGAKAPAPAPVPSTGSGTAPRALAGELAGAAPTTGSFAGVLRVVGGARLAALQKNLGVFQVVLGETALSRVEGVVGTVDAGASLLAPGFESVAGSGSLLATAGRLRAVSGVVSYLTVPWELAKMVAGARMDAEATIAREAFLWGAARGVVARIGGRSGPWTLDRFRVRGGSIDASLVRRTLFDGGRREVVLNNRGLIQGFEAGKGLSDEERRAFILYHLRQAQLAGTAPATIRSPWRNGLLRGDLVGPIAGAYYEELAESFAGN